MHISPVSMEPSSAIVTWPTSGYVCDNETEISTSIIIIIIYVI